MLPSSNKVYEENADDPDDDIIDEETDDDNDDDDNDDNHYYRAVLQSEYKNEYETTSLTNYKLST